jgi:rubrerythrin
MRKFGGGVENFSMFNSNKINYYCMVCGTKHDNLMCPKCGSKMKKIG